MLPLPLTRLSKPRLPRAEVIFFEGVVTANVLVTPCPIQFFRPRTGHVHLERMMAFALLDAIWCAAYPCRLRWAPAGMLILAVVLEAAQAFDPSCHGRVPDAVEKAVGGLLGVVGRATSAELSTAMALNSLNVSSGQAIRTRDILPKQTCRPAGSVTTVLEI